MSASEETSPLFPLFVLSVLVIPLAPYTWYSTWNFLTDNAKTIHCQCALCFTRKFKRVSSSSTSKIFIILLLWATVAALIYYIKHTVPDPQLFEPYSILGLEVGASESEIKKAYRKLSILHHPDKNPDHEANVYFIEFISKAYQTLTDAVARENYEKYGHPDGRQGYKVGIALPAVIMQVDGPAAGYVLLGIFGICIILPMIVTLFYLLRSSKYTSNFIMHKTMSAYFHSMTPSLSPSKLIDIFIEAEEFEKIPIRKGDDESLRQLFALVKNELSSDETNTKVDQRKFWKQDLHRIEKLLLVHAHLTRQLNSLSSLQHRDLELILKIAPNLLEELMKIALAPRAPLGHGFLKSAAAVVKFHQNIIQAVPLSARKTTTVEPEGIAPFLQLPHFTEAIVKKLHNEGQSPTFQELRKMSMSERSKLLSDIAGFSNSEVHDIETVLKTMPTIALDISIRTENEEGIEEKDITTMQAWVSIKRENNLTAALPHAPHFPFYKEENFWLVLADPDSNEVWLSHKLNFMDEYQITSSARKLTRSLKEGSGASYEEVKEEVRLAVEKARNGSQLVVGRFSAPKKGTYKLVAYCFCDAWIGCDAKAEIDVEILQGICRCSHCLRGQQGAEVMEEEDEVSEDYESEYSDDDEDGKEKKN